MADEKKTARSIPVKAPDGEVYFLAPEDLAEGVMRGGKPVMLMGAPDGNQYWIPTDEIEEGLKQGGHLLKQDGSAYPDGQEPIITGHNAAGQPIWGTQEEQPQGSAAGRFAGSAAQALWNALTGIVGLLDPQRSDAERELGLTNLYDDLMYPFERLVTPNVEEGEKSVKAFQQAIADARSKKGTDAAGDVAEGLGRALATVIPGVGPMVAEAGAQAGTQAGTGDMAGAAGTLAGNAAALAGPEIVKGGGEFAANRVSDAAGTTAALDKPLAAGEMTPRERYQAAQDMGVNLDRAQATNATLPKIAKRVTEQSLGGRDVYEGNNAANLDALHAHTTGMLDSTAPAMTREEFGTAVRDGLDQHRTNLMQQVNDLYAGLDERLGGAQPDFSAVHDAAKKIYEENKDVYTKHPDLLTGGGKRAWSIVKDFAGVDESKTASKPKPTASAEEKPEGPTSDTWSGLQTMRSHLLDLTRGPEFIGDKASGWVKQMTGAIDHTMTSAEKTPGLSPADVDDFRNANMLYKHLQDVYEDNKSPFYWMSREPDGLKTADKVNQLNPTQLQQFREIATATDRPELIDQHQRQTMERLLDPSGNGTADLKNFPSRWNRTQKEQMQGALTDDQVKNLEDLAQVSRAVNWDVNPSGTAKVAQPAAEAGAMLAGLGSGVTMAASGHPIAGAMGAITPVAGALAERGVASRMVNPEATAAVMDRAPVNTPMDAVRNTAADIRNTVDTAARAPLEHPLRSAVVGASAAGGQQPQGAEDVKTAADKWRAMNAPKPAVPVTPSEREGVSTLPDEGHVTSTGASEPNEMHNSAQAAKQMNALSGRADSELQPDANPGGGVYRMYGPQGQVIYQNSAGAPQGASHEVVDPDNGAVLGHVVNGEYVALEDQ